MSLLGRRLLRCAVFVLPLVRAALYNGTTGGPPRGRLLAREPGTSAAGPSPGTLIQDQLAATPQVSLGGTAAGEVATASLANATQAGPSPATLQEEIHDLKRELDELRQENRQRKSINPFTRIKEIFSPFRRFRQAPNHMAEDLGTPPGPDGGGRKRDLETDDTAVEEDQDPLAGMDDDDGQPMTYAGPVGWDMYSTAPMVIIGPTMLVIFFVCVYKVLQPSLDQPATPPTRVGMPAWNTKTDAIFIASDRDRDGFLSYSDMRWMARVTNPEGAGHFTFEWYKDLCRPLGVDPQRGFDREEFRQSLMLLGNDVDRDFDVVTRNAAPQQARSSTGS